MVLFDTKTNQVIEDAEERKDGKSGLITWVHGETGQPIAFSFELEHFGYKVLHENAPDVLEVRLKAVEALLKDIAIGGQMPDWFIEYTKKLEIKEGKQEGIRQTYAYENKDWINYFDSSFPSTFLAGYKIVSNLLNNKVVQERYADKNTIKIADIGCGSGGAIIGTITAINLLLPSIKNIELYAFDFNINALDVLRECLKACPNNKVNKLELKQVQFVPKSTGNALEYTFEEFDKDILKEDAFDFILCFKMVNELISPLNKQGFEAGAYYNIVQIATKHISEQGFFILLDVSMSNEKDEKGKPKDNTHYAHLLNKGVNIFLQKNAAYKCIIPIPCAIVSKCQAEYCWIQRMIKPENGREFPATYKVLTKTQFGNSIIEAIMKYDTSKYIIQERKKDEKNNTIFKRCFYQNGKMTQSEDITKERIADFKNGFCI